MAKRPFRVVLHAMTLRRDFPPWYILRQLLENLGAVVAISSVRNYVWLLRTWRPHVVVYPTAGKTPVMMETFPQAKLVLYSGEGGESKTTLDEGYFARRPEIYRRMSKILLWGRNARELMVQMALEAGDEKLAEDFLHGTKLEVVGHPRLDVCRFWPSPERKGRRGSIGLAGHFFTLNCMDGRSALHFAFADRAHQSNLEAEVRTLRLYLDLIDFILERTDSRVSIRPYPLEAPDQYLATKGDRAGDLINPRYRGRVEIDRSIDFATWASKQDLIVSSVSTLVTEAYLLKVPVVFIDQLSGNLSLFCARNEVNRILSDMVPQAGSFEELCRFVADPSRVPLNKERMAAYWDDYYNLNEQHSFLLKAAKAVVREWQSGCHSLKPGMPLSLFRRIDDLLFFRQRMKNPLHPNFNFKEGYHRLAPQYDEVARKIIAQARDLN